MHDSYRNVTTLCSGILAIGRASAVCLSSSVCNVQTLYSADWTLFLAILYASHPLIFVRNFAEIGRSEPLRRGLNARGVAKYSDVGHIEGYIWETMQDTASDTLNTSNYKRSISSSVD